MVNCYLIVVHRQFTNVYSNVRSVVYLRIRKLREGESCKPSSVTIPVDRTKTGLAYYVEIQDICCCTDEELPTGELDVDAETYYYRYVKGKCL